MSRIAGPVLLVGCGKMGSALLHGWIRHGLATGEVAVVEPDKARQQQATDLGVLACPAADQLPKDFVPKAIVFAIKPQGMADALPAYRPLAEASTLILSIAAGTAIARFEAAFGPATPVARAMPNTPAAIGKGVAALFANDRVDQEGRQLCAALMAAVGAVHWLDNEDQMHAVTAMSGGGPAYVFLLMETLARAGIASGLPPKLAWPMARDTVVGSGMLARADDSSPEVLRRNVTSPGGTTAAALAVLMADDHLQILFDRAIAAATDRSRALA